MTATTPDQLRQRAADHETAAEHGALLKDAEAHRETAAMLRAAADQLEAVQALLAEAHDKFAATYDAERMTGRGPSSIGVAGAPLALSVRRALDLLRAKATANIERLTADTAPQENERTVMRVEGHPRVGDVYEGKYGAAKGKRIRLVRFNDAPAHLNRWFATQTIHHPSSPRMIGSTGTVGVQQLEDRWRLVKAEASDG